MKAYHGTNTELNVVAAGCWITLDPDAAIDFAFEKVKSDGGVPVVLLLEIEENDVDWDVLSMGCGVEDERGTLLKDVATVSHQLVMNSREFPSVP